MIFNRTQLSVKCCSVPLVVAIMRWSWLYISQKSAVRIAVQLCCFYGHVVSCV